MKNIFCMILSMLFVFSSMSQTSEDEKTYHPLKGDFSFELNFIPFSNSGPIDLTQFRARYFIQDRLALNLFVNYDYEKQNNEYPILISDVLYFETEDKKFSLFGMGAGLEYHFLKTKRVAVYGGFQLLFTTKSSDYEYKDINYGNWPDPGVTESLTTAENAWFYEVIEYDFNGYPYRRTELSERAFNAFTTNLVLGSEVYIIKHLYMGVELGFGYTQTNYKQVDVKENGNVRLIYPEAKETSLGLNFNQAIRLGFWF